MLETGGSTLLWRCKVWLAISLMAFFQQPVRLLLFYRFTFSIQTLIVGQTRELEWWEISTGRSSGNWQKCYKLKTHTFRPLHLWDIGRVSDEAMDNVTMVVHAYRNPTWGHSRRFNLPEFSKIAAIVPGADDGHIGKRVIRVHRRVVNDVRMENDSLTKRSHVPLITLFYAQGVVIVGIWICNKREKSDTSDVLLVSFVSKIRSIQRHPLWKASRPAVFGGLFLQDWGKTFELAETKSIQAPFFELHGVNIRFVRFWT